MQICRMFLQDCSTLYKGQEKHTKTRKAAGPNGLLASYYKCFEDECLQHLQQTMNIIPQNGKIPDRWKEANITSQKIMM